MIFLTNLEKSNKGRGMLGFTTCSTVRNDQNGSQIFDVLPREIDHRGCENSCRLLVQAHRRCIKFRCRTRATSEAAYGSLDDGIRVIQD